MQSTGSKEWKTHIDGLRAVAVLSVLLFHAHVPFVSGGYVGVDIFFVISGYLISKVIFDEIKESNRFNFFNFYERRARRILPVFVLVTTLCVVVGGFIYLPPEFIIFAKSAIAACAFTANIFFYSTSDYFAPAAETIPLMHYWSLGIEEQFYIFFPILVLFAWRFGPTVLTALLALLFIASFTAAQFYLTIDQTASFFLLPHRAWELLAGSVLALPWMRFSGSRLMREAASAIGIAIIGYALFAYTAKTSFPGLAAGAPVLGAFLILWSCDRNQTMIGRALSWTPLRLIGLWSYSIYMIHWPLIVFTKELQIPIGAATSTFLVSASVLLGALSYKYIETPFRDRTGFLTSRRIAALSFASLTSLAGVAAIVVGTDGFMSRLPPPVREALGYHYFSYKEPFRSEVCFLRPEQTWSALDQRACLRTGEKSVLLWGDSHGAHFQKPLGVLVEDSGGTFSQATASQCPPIIGYQDGTRPNCLAFNVAAFDWINSARPKVVVMSAVWPTDQKSLAQLDATIRALGRLGVRIVLVGDTPRFTSPVPDIVARRMLRMDSNPYAGDHLTGHAVNTDGIFRKNFADLPSVTYVSPFEKLCSKEGCPIVGPTGMPLYFDISHMTTEASQMAIDRMFKDTAVLARALND
jgi:peptidoglycan/LPS O-acetylase OafA/YrhL